MNKWLILVVFVVYGFTLFAQYEGSDVYVTKGGTGIDLKISSITRIVDGVTYTDFLELSIRYCDNDHTTTGWELYVYSLFPEFESMLNNDPTIPLDKILISSRMDDGTEVAVNESLSQTELLLGSGNAPIAPDNCVEDKVIITIKCSSLSGYETDYYTTDLNFELKTVN